MQGYEIRWRRGSYMARIDGTDDKYGLRREFADARTVKRDGGRLVYETLEPGWYEVREGRGPKRYVGVSELGETFELPESFALVADVASVGPVPGQPGCWLDTRCECGAEVTAYDGQGFPHCDDHAPEAAAPVAPDGGPAPF